MRLTPILMVLTLVLAAAPTVGQESPELQELGTTLKAAVLSGALSEKDAWQVYQLMAAELSPGTADKGSDDVWPGGRYASKWDVSRLMPAEPGDIRQLFRPDLLQRDLRRLNELLELDDSQRQIVELLLADYSAAFDVASRPLRESLDRYRRIRDERQLLAALDRVEFDDPDASIARIRESMTRMRADADAKRTDQETAEQSRTRRDRQDEWTARMIEASASMQQHLTDLRERVESRARSQNDVALTPAILVRQAMQLRDDRNTLRESLLTAMRLILVVDDSDHLTIRRVNDVLSRLRVENELVRGRLGGETMNLWRAMDDLNDFEPAGEIDDRILRGLEARLGTGSPSALAAIDARTHSAVDREIVGLRLIQARDESASPDSDPEVADAQQRYVNACRAEVNRSIAVRDALLDLLDVMVEAVSIMPGRQPFAEAYRDAALRRGFQTETRPRWAERAIAAAVDRTDLTEQVAAQLAMIDQETTAALRTLRRAAVDERIRRDETWARQLANPEERPRWDLAEVDIRGTDFDALDDGVERQLRSLLEPAQFESLPIRRDSKRVADERTSKK